MKIWELLSFACSSHAQMGYRPMAPINHGQMAPIGPYGHRMGTAGGHMAPAGGYIGHRANLKSTVPIGTEPVFQPGSKNAFVRENNAVRKVNIHENIHQGAICGKTLNFSLIPGSKQTLKSPKYPAGFSSQTQCVWQIESTPGTRIRVDFEQFNIAMTGRACSSVYLEFSSVAYDPNGNRKKEGSGSFKVCGKNPGYIISNTNMMTVWLHADESNMGTEQKFLLKLSATKENPRVLALDGHAVADGRPKGSLARNDPMPFGPQVNGGPIKGVGGSLNGRGGFRSRSPTNVITPSDYQDAQNNEIEAEPEDNRMKNLGIMFLFVAAAISLIAGAVCIRQRIEKKNAVEEDNHTRQSEVKK